jgi:pimeloyl-ACP methyl ester carboxylesterase
MDLDTRHAFDARRSTIQTRSGPISFVDTGDIGAGPPAVFVHGVGTNASLWRQVIARLGTEHRCVALDLPLHGRSPARTDQDFSLGALADVVAAFCDALDLAHVHLVAHDTGGALAQILAARHPDRLVTLTLTNCETHDNVPPDAFKPTVELARAGLLAPAAPGLLADPAAARAAVFAMGYEDPERLSTDMVRAYLEPVIGTAEAAALFERLLSSLEPGDLLRVEPALAELTVPTLVVWGTGDAFFDVRWAYWLRDTIPGVTEVVEIEGAKLFFPDERADDLVPHLRRHWAAAERASVGA